MTLTVGRGPFGHDPAGSFNVEIPSRERLLFVEPSRRWIRGVRAGETVVDSRTARVVYEQGRLPIYFFGPDDVRGDLLTPSEHRSASPILGEASWYGLRVGEDFVERAAWSFPEPPRDAVEVAGLIAFRWDALDHWYEEDEELIVHLRDPYHRIDVMPTSRHLRISLDGELLAETHRAMVLYETALPPRWYIPREDVSEGLASPSDHRTGCAYKGFASYLSVRVGDREEENLVWTYPDPRHEVAPIRDYLCFFDERVDTEIDGELQERPLTPWSPLWRDPNPEEASAG
jgi:uncharacterized protein (DUF427 family)